MMKHSNIILSFLLILWVFMMDSCKKFLDAKPDKHLAVPSGLVDYQAILDWYSVINDRGVSALTISSDDYYYDDNDFSSLSEVNQNKYLWKRKNVFRSGYDDWNNIYTIAYYANTAIENLPNISRTSANADAWDNAMGQGYFTRANAFFQVALAWTQAYDQATASKDLGIPLKLTTDFNIPSRRSTIQQTYDQIISDLKKSIRLLPVHAVHPMRPGKPAAYALLARIYLYMREYPLAYLYADSCLQLRNDLMDYNQIDPSPKYPIPKFNIEELYFEYSSPISKHEKVDSTLYSMFDNNDLRKTLFFSDNGDGSHAYRGSYAQNLPPFIGVATDEVYLMKAECEARLGKTSQAMDDLNTLLITRWKTGTFIPYTASSQQDALSQILMERRKELIKRQTRWMDVKRLNKEGYNITMTRYTLGKTYTLAPNSAGYALPIPAKVIQLSGMPQNPD